jgi:hypothetical protein
MRPKNVAGGRAGGRAGIFVVGGVSVVALGRPALADETPAWDPGRHTTDELRGEVVPMSDKYGSDGVYDRFDGDVTFALGLGAEIGNGARGAILSRALYYYTAGLFFGYADALGSDTDLRRVLFVGTEVRPLFLPRWSLDMQVGLPLIDLALDSLAVSAGAYWGQPRDGAFADAAGFEGAIGFGIPLLGTSQGPWLEARGTYRVGLPEEDLGVTLLLSWYETWISPVIR